MCDRDTANIEKSQVSSDKTNIKLNQGSLKHKLVSLKVAKSKAGESMVVVV